MEDKGKGFSLRKKASRRLPISAPKQISAPLPAQGTSRSNGHGQLLDIPRERPQLGGKTSDLVKRRYSTRFTHLPDFSQDGESPVPSIPLLPGQYSQPPSWEEPPAGSQAPTVDMKALRDPELQPEKYVADLLVNASEQDIREYQSSLRKLKYRTSTDLQQNVYQNRTQFIKISKEAEKLKGEMRTLRSLMSELTSALGQATVSGGSASTSDLRSPSHDDRALTARKRANRSSVANLEAMWSTQLQALWKNVEQSQKFLPAIPGRHIVHESSHWVELDSATWKSRRPVHIFLLNDHLMVATRKKKRVDQNINGTNGQRQHVATKLVAERCWPLEDIDMVDLASGHQGPQSANGASHDRDISNAINVRVGQESFTYRHDQPDSAEKLNLLLTFRRTVEELRKLLRVDAEGNSSKSKDSLSYLAAQDPILSKKNDLLATLNTSKDRPEILIDVDGKQRNLRWIEGQIDELDIDVALQRFEEGIRKIEGLRKIAKGLKSNAIAHDLITVKVDQRAAKMAAFVNRRLVDTHAFLNATQTNVNWLVRLGFEDQAREAFLEARSVVIVKRARQCVFEGDLHQYIYQISFVYFTVIRNTVSIYQQCFPPLLMSACVKWAKEHVDGFNVILARQLSSVKTDSPVWAECMERAREHAMLLAEVGLDFKDLIGKDIHSGSQVRNGVSMGIGMQ
ncbi:MAG: exocyst complex component exo84 [Pleopsidium flavum]|nr:MAG: exocyst complex component exo84 [Pleopsidium flavum]